MDFLLYKKHLKHNSKLLFVKYNVSGKSCRSLSFYFVPRVTVFFTSGGISENLNNSLMQPLAAILCSEEA